MVSRVIQIFQFRFLTFLVIYVTEGSKIGMTRDEKISAMEAELKQSKGASFTTSNGRIGLKGAQNLEMFDNKSHNIVKNADLMPCPRRPPKK